MSSYDASLCGLPQQPSKGDNRRHAGTVEEEEGGHALEAHSILKVTQVERSFPLDVLYQPPKQPDHSTQTHEETSGLPSTPGTSSANSRLTVVTIIRALVFLSPGYVDFWNLWARGLHLFEISLRGGSGVVIYVKLHINVVNLRLLNANYTNGGQLWQPLMRLLLPEELHLCMKPGSNMWCGLCGFP